MGKNRMLYNESERRFIRENPDTIVRNKSKENSEVKGSGRKSRSFLTFSQNLQKTAKNAENGLKNQIFAKNAHNNTTTQHLHDMFTQQISSNFHIVLIINILLNIFLILYSVVSCCFLLFSCCILLCFGAKCCVLTVVNNRVNRCENTTNRGKTQQKNDNTQQTQQDNKNTKYWEIGFYVLGYFKCCVVVLFLRKIQPCKKTSPHKENTKIVIL